ncbi:hypothetical protein COW36_17450 [bacterium (Candidatus Blackallbacteria) CG17_big_fil_post_rev_8_21_14_2_50_48_46]|uniref:Uncharacterized protein n=1 Tax=bacterium (Candidatus Blackallbacteria) CG17_big_fil_post_rev_8_21_14_2_50_48_46 TaxID=2014261 RepID=A0A2M7G0Z5_9BACT|nr:MAG: hypothetical protein COW64_01280 [bacterium (Candidatus Blackallbacteria) CG18_big_fil_WC_8_21_14_2_50_49_26]PIW15207.1 MAG: hypothetical protein COW36_17450 [bacterium (Candidatus Blackallbacteria) CG17_big_fil_post_rev_8_21_14_2_50_48_46]PIW44794.1 MAG: hypothetical protein COW20_22785 [bacterium (Candidatus Blackallbacteria) CG13_big_fil_rev_8_21_14_2_50_49_14]
MKKFQRSLAILVGTLALMSCGGDRAMQLHGKMTKIQHLGETCWVFMDDQHRYYEVITPSSQILHEGLQMSIRAIEVQSKTLCELPTVIEIIEYRPDHFRDM